MRVKIAFLTVVLLFIGAYAFAQSQSGGACNLSGSNQSGGLYLHQILTGSGTDDSPYLFGNAGRNLYFGTNGETAAPKMVIDTAGKVGVGTSAPVAKLDVSGDIRIGNTASACTTANEGAVRYSNASKALEFCNGTAWTAIGAVTKPVAPTVTLSASPTAVNAGSAVTLSWTSTNATSVWIDQGIGNVSLNGSRSIAPSQTTTYTITATGTGGTVTSSATVQVYPIFIFPIF